MDIIASPSRFRTWRFSAPNADQLAVLSAAVLCLALIALNAVVHPTVRTDSAEIDGYTTQAAQLLAGNGYTDHFHPPLYVLLTAPLSLVTRLSTFHAGSLFSSVSVALAAYLIYHLARRFLSPRLSLLCMALFALDATVVEHGLYASTDALNLLLTIAVLWVTLRASTDRDYLVLGALFGLAVLTRYTSLAFALIVGYAVLDRNLYSTLRRAALASSAAFVVLSPWLAWNTVANGSPFASDSLQNFAFAVYGKPYDWSTFAVSAHSNGVLGIVVTDPGAVLALWLRNARALLLAVPLLHSGSLFVGLFLPFGIWRLLRSRLGRLPLLHIAATIGPVMLTFLYMPRLVLPAIPIFILAGLVGVDYIAGHFALFRRRRVLCVSLIAAFALLLQTQLLIARLQQMPT